MISLIWFNEPKPLGGRHKFIEKCISSKKSRKHRQFACQNITTKNSCVLKIYINQLIFLQITSTKLQWNAKPKIGSLDNASYKPGGGDKKIESLKTDFKDKAKSKVGSKENMKHLPGGGEFKVNYHQAKKFF